jgi:tetratricopeptide (TPR) repeat protein
MLHTDSAASTLDQEGLLHEDFVRALQYHQRGDFPRAEALYREILLHEAQHADALHGLGVLVSQLGNHALAAEIMQQAVAYQPEAASFHNDLGIVYMRQGHFTAAVAAYQSALRLQADLPETYYNLGVVYQRQENLAAAAVAYQEAVRLQPGYVQAYYNLGAVCRLQGNFVAAIGAYQAVLRLQPDYLEAQFNLGVVQQQQGDLPAAAAAYAAVLHVHPDYVDAHINLGVVKLCLGELVEAVAAFRTVLRLQPTHFGASYNLGKALHMQGDLAGAQQAYEASLRLQPEYADAYNDLGVVLQSQGDLPGAMTAYQTAVHFHPECAEAHWNSALLWLGMGALAHGWAAYEWRWRTNHQTLRAFPQPRWKGTSLAGRTILVHAEQGVGDELFFASCFPDLMAQAGHVVLECDTRLASLWRRSFPGATVHGGDRSADLRWLARMPPIDVQIPMGSLPALLRSRLRGFPMRSSYLVPDAAQQERWRARLAALGPGLNIGIAWRSLAGRGQESFYTRLHDWAAILSCPGVHWINLQYDQCAAELATARREWGIAIHAWEDLDIFRDLDGVAALMSTLDLIIAPDTMTAVLAAGLGQPVWRLQVYMREWDALGTDVVPWFPTMRLYRQPRAGAWGDVLAQVARDVRRLTPTMP